MWFSNKCAQLNFSDSEWIVSHKTDSDWLRALLSQRLFENHFKSYENSQQAQKNISDSQYKEKAKDVMKSNQYNLAESGIKQKNQKSSQTKIGPFYPILVHNFNPFILNYEMPNTINRIFDIDEV